MKRALLIILCVITDISAFYMVAYEITHKLGNLHAAACGMVCGCAFGMATSSIITFAKKGTSCSL